jgi:hypothetical protein
MLHLVLYVLALLAFVLAAFGVPARVNLEAAGLALLTLTLLV